MIGTLGAPAFPATKLKQSSSLTQEAADRFSYTDTANNAQSLPWVRPKNWESTGGIGGIPPDPRQAYPEFLIVPGQSIIWGTSDTLGALKLSTFVV
jgi:hypothetical protein